MVKNSITNLFVPGLLSDERVWRKVCKSIEGNNAVANVTRDNDIREMAKRLLAEHAGKLLIIGHSMGARVAIEMAYQAPERVEGLVLANTGHAPLQQGERERRQYKILMAHENMQQMVAEWLPPMLAEGRDTDASLVADLTDMATQIGPIVHQQQIEALINRPNATEILPQISCPVLLITGDKDLWSPLKQHQEMAELLPSVTLKVIKNAGHFMPIEQPDSTQSIIATWMRSTFPEG